MRNKFYDFHLNQRNRNFYFFDFFKIFHSFFQIHFNFIDSFCEKIPSVNVILRNFRTYWCYCSYLNRLSFTKIAYVIFKLINFSVKFILFNFIIFQNVYIVLILINLTLQLILEYDFTFIGNLLLRIKLVILLLLLILVIYLTYIFFQFFCLSTFNF